MRNISRDELKAKLDRGEPIRLVMALGRRQFRLKHIPGSLQFDSYAEGMRALKRDEEIVLYCTGAPCPASKTAYSILAANGFTRLTHYPGGLPDLEEAGYPVEGLLAMS